jgi:hypothetical protein
MTAYHENERNHCPGCARTHWYIGLATAECAFCGTALPLASNGRAETSPRIRTFGKGGGKVSRRMAA